MTATQSDTEWLDDQIKDAEFAALLSPPLPRGAWTTGLGDVDGAAARTEALERARRLRSIRARLENA